MVWRCRQPLGCFLCSSRGGVAGAMGRIRVKEDVMAKDDYDVIVFKILTYLYACRKRKIVFDEDVFKAAISYGAIQEDYFMDIRYMINEEGLIERVGFTKAWGGNVIALFSLNELRISSVGVRYLTDNVNMEKVKDVLRVGFGLLPDLVRLVFGG